MVPISRSLTPSRWRRWRLESAATFPVGRPDSNRGRRVTWRRSSMAKCSPATANPLRPVRVDYCGRGVSLSPALDRTTSAGSLASSEVLEHPNSISARSTDDIGACPDSVETVDAAGMNVQLNGSAGSSDAASVFDRFVTKDIQLTNLDIRRG